MAVTTQQSAQKASTDRLWQHELGGKLSMAYFTHTQDGAGDAGSSVAVVKLPPGRVRLIGPLSMVPGADWTTFDVGWDEHEDMEGNTVDADPDGIDDGVTAAEAAVGLGSALSASGGTKLFESKTGVRIRMTSPGALSDGNAIAGFLTYVKES